MFRPKLRKRAARIALLLGIPYLLVLVAVFVWQRHLLFFPDKVPYDLSLTIAQRSGFEPWLNGSGQVIGWKQICQTNGPRDRVLITHGNAGSALNRMDFADMLKPVGSFDVYILEYPGYGARSGSPTEKSLCEAADEAIALLAKDGPVYVIGESLGTGVAAHLAGAHPESVAGLLLIAPYHNLGDVAQHQMPVFPAKWMLWDRFPSGENLRNYHGRVAVLLAGQDTVVPNKFGRRLYDSYAGPKKVWAVPEATHNSLPSRPEAWWRELVAFWNS
jgi:pimeloyl-ACP methyl ester carboxylesterase